MKKIILIETSDVGARPTGEAVRRLGFDPVFLVNLNNYQGDTLSQIQSFEHYQIDTTSIEEMASWLEEKNWEIEAITTFLDSRLHLAIALSEKFKVRGLEKGLLPFKDKGYVENIAPGICPPSLSFHLQTAPEAEIESLRAKCSSVILKPRCTAGGLGARRFEHSESFENIRQYMAQLEIPAHLSPGEWMVQAFVEGELVSVEGFVENGVSHILGITGRRKIGNTESWAGFPYDSRLRPEVRELAMGRVRDLIQISQLQNSFFHIELMVNSTEAYVIDANLGRIGGGGISEILATAYGVSTTDLFSEVLCISLKLQAASACFWSRRPEYAISVAYGVSESCTLTQVHLPPVQNIYHTQILMTGTVPAMGDNNWSWVGIASGSTGQVLDFLSQLKINTTDGVRVASYSYEEGIV